MLLLYPDFESAAYAIPPIYIPLCFYFIDDAIDALTGFVVNLHSTMLLLYRNKKMKQYIIKRIYIPLCFYFI